MEVKIKDGNGYVEADWTIEDGVMVVSPKKAKFEPKDGDVCKSTSCIYIFKRADNAKAVVYYCCLNVYLDELSVKQSIGVGYVDEYQRYATEEEKKKLFDKLKEEGYEWDAEKKEIVKLKWKPKYNDTYWSLILHDAEHMPWNYTWQNSAIGNKRLGKGWVFRTKEECQEFCDKSNQAISQVKP